MTRPTTDIIASLRAALAELEYALRSDEDISPRLREALAEPSVGEAVREGSAKHEESAALPKPYAPPSLEYTSSAKGKRPRDYVPDDELEGFDESVFMGTGDRNEWR